VRKATGTGTEIRNGITVEYFAYQSETPEEDVAAYLEALLNDKGYTPTVDPDTREPEGAGINSVDPGHWLEVTAKTEPGGYVIYVYYVPGELEMISDPTQPYDDPTQPYDDQLPSNNPFNETTAGNGSDYSDTDDAYSVGPDKVPSINKAVGYRKSTSSFAVNILGVTTLQVDYLSDSPGMDAMGYYSYLRENDGFISLADVTFTDPEGETKLGRSSVEPGYILIATLKWTAEGYNLEVSRMEGEIVPND
jgi:hypothetical protein